MYFSTLKNISQLVFISLVLSACTGSEAEDTTQPPVNNSKVSVATIPSDSQKVATTLNQISINFTGPVDIDSVQQQNITFLPAISYTLDASLLASNGLLLLTVTGDLMPNTAYRGKISGVMDQSAAAVATINWGFSTNSFSGVQPPADLTPPTAPGNLRTFNLSSSAVSLAWDASTDDVALGGYRVYRNNVLLSTESGTTFVDTSVMPSQSYEYWVIAYDQTQKTARSNYLLVNTPSGGTAPTPPAPNPPVPGDTTAPTVVATTPNNGSTQVSPNIAAITVNFSEAIDPTSINGSNFVLDNGVTGTISTLANDTGAQFVPSAALARGTTYTASLRNVTDVAGNSLTANSQQVYSWSFSTCGDTPSSTYTISWNAIADADLTGYNVYYGLTSSLSKANSTPVSVGSATSWVMNPTSLGFKPCDTVYIAITALGSVKSESALSTLISQVVN
ncbi:hypothetical protein MNBD_GAMMA09-218 [hydrothermal vent metagenome]|uniref:Fibronectin type-III domain-containing protein n=1 Tax=hydrothermal vent metagenome TaxID=652676 RepID=A0A3B0XRU4_9ZZZZ